MVNKILLRPIHYACVSGGEDSLYMFYYILQNKDKYPLDYVIHYELEIDYPFIKNVVDNIEKICNKLNIPFMRIKPRKKWKEIYDKRNYPTIACRWCNGEYKMDCERQFKKMVKQWNCRPVAYIGFCANETKRFKYKIGDWLDKDICYPLAEENIYEDKILEWAKQQPIYNNYYNYFTRCGCMGCPLASMKEWTYIYIYYPEKYYELMELIEQSEKIRGRNQFHCSLKEFRKKVETKSLKISLF